MSDKGDPPRWLIVVRRDQPDLYHNLKESFADVPRVAVILDRRQGERRAAETTPDGAEARERRGQQRRRPLPVSEQQLWAAAGFRLIHEAGDLSVYESPPDMPQPDPARDRPRRKTARET